MARRDQVTRRGQIDALKKKIDVPSAVRVKTRAAVHVRSTTAGVCPCCNSPLAKIDDEWDDLDVLIDIDQDRRYFRHLEDPEAYDQEAEHVDFTVDSLIRCAPHTVELTFSETTWTVGTGASRSMKTQTGAYWGYRQWLLRGGPSALGCILGFELEQAHILKDKLVVGEGENPPVIDPRLVLDWPAHIRSPDQHIHMVDGFRWRLQHTKGDGGNLSGRSWVCAIWTEIAKTRDPRNYAQVRGRIVSARGKLYGDAVPEASHWAHRVLIEPSEEWELEAGHARAAGKEPPRRTHLAKFLPTAENPWNDEQAAKDFESDLMRLDPRIAARYARGEWVGDKNKTFGEYFDAPTHTFELEKWAPRHLGLADITSTAVLQHFTRPANWIVSVDVNANPHTALIGKICIPHEVLEADPLSAAANRWHWQAVFWKVFQVWGLDSAQAADALRTLDDGEYADAAVIMDGTSGYERHNAGGQLNARKGYVPKRCYEAAGFEVLAPDRHPSGKPKNPERFGSAILGRRLLRDRDPAKIHINRLPAGKLVRALRDQESEDDGITPARASNTSADRHIVSLTDTFRYWLWPFFPVDVSEAAPLVVREYA
ncbi:MAG: hypothetical protein AAF721_00375 [Myxococcota bacterium]